MSQSLQPQRLKKLIKRAKMRNSRTRAKPAQGTGVSLPSDGFLRQKAILKLIPVSRATWWNWVKSGKAPKPLNLGPNMTAWRVSDIRELIDRLSKEGAA